MVSVSKPILQRKKPRLRNIKQLSKVTKLRRNTSLTFSKHQSQRRKQAAKMNQGAEAEVSIATTYASCLKTKVLITVLKQKRKKIK